MSDRPSGEATPASTRPNYKKTLNLPRTAFPMRANLVQNEPASLKRWARIDVYQRLRQRAEQGGEPRFSFHDGPPYANGPIHIGHLVNKCLKDFVIRTRSMMGLDTPFIPGWDCHGLPIEHKVVSEMIDKGEMAKIETLDEAKRRVIVRKACEGSAQKYIKLQSEQMRRLLTVGDYQNPYLTMSPDYERATLEVFAEMVEQGLVFRALKPVHWSIANETALAEAELEYYERTDPSVYVEFEATDRSAVEKAFGLEPAAIDRTPTFMIWTTTPWTLPANLAIAAHPRLRYALVDLAGSITVLAEDLVEAVAKKAGADSVRTIATAEGERLVGLRYAHPFIDGGALAKRLGTEGIHRLVPGEYVTTEDGTGLVHTAPGHGAEDYQTGLKESLPVYCPVRGDGTYDESVPDWLRGVQVFAANEAITEKVRATGHLFHDEAFSHSYPHDWRGKTPVIFRATEQWFVGVDRPSKRDARSLRQAAAEGVEQTRFLPAWGRNRLRGMLETRPDWCISRQRAWGLPIPAFFTPEGETLLTPTSVRCVAKAIGEDGSTAWFTETPERLLRHYDPAGDPDAPEGLDLSTLRKGGDIFDVWFESGSSWNAVLRHRAPNGDAEINFPADLYLEGSDQHRGWFHLSLLCALGAHGEAPFKTLLTHGFVVDKEGRKMSKSLGNTIDVDDLLKEYGAEVCRWWVASLAYENDVKADASLVGDAGELYRKVRNTLRFMLSNLSDFDSAGAPEETPAPTSLEAWALSAFDDLRDRVVDAYERYDFRGATSLLYQFCNETMSATYLAAVKDRLYCDDPESPRRRRTQSTLWRLADGLCRLLAPVLAHTADEAHRSLRGAASEDNACVHLERFPERSGAAADEAWSVALSMRDRAMSALERVRGEGGVENPLDAGLRLPDPEGALRGFDPVDLADLMGVSRVELTAEGGEVDVLDLRAEPRCERSWKRDGTVRERSDGGMLSDRDAEAIGVA